MRKVGFRFMSKCPMSYDVCYIRQDGGVSPCSCALPNVVYGNIFEDSLGNIWNGKNFKRFRRKQKGICSKCTLYKLKI